MVYITRNRNNDIQQKVIKKKDLLQTCRRKVKLDCPMHSKQTNLKLVYSWNKLGSIKSLVQSLFIIEGAMFFKIGLLQRCLNGWTEVRGRGFKSHSEELSIATSINSSVVGEYHLHQFILLNASICLRPKYSYFKPRQTVR